MRYKDEILELRHYHPRVFVKQINKTEAKRIYEAKGDIFLNASNMLLNNSWTSPMRCNHLTLGADRTSFAQIVTEYEYYNCDNVRGKYANFFKEVKL